MSTTKQDRAAELRTAIDNCLRICQLEMLKAAPNLDYAFDFAYKAQRSIETLRIMSAHSPCAQGGAA